MMKKSNLIIVALALLFFSVILILAFFNTKKQNEKKSTPEEEVSTLDTSPIKYVNTYESHFQNREYKVVRYPDDEANKVSYQIIGVTFIHKFTLLNNTDQQISTFNLIGCLHIEFNGETSCRIYFPCGHYRYEKFDDYTEFEGAYSTNNTSITRKWYPKEEKQLEFILCSEHAHSWGETLVGFDVSDFERTPVIAELIYKYKAIGIDGEYEDVVRIDILDKWKEFQTKLGFR